MSPIAALHDPVFRAYVGLALGLLALAGAVLAFLQFVRRFELASVWTTYRSWLWMAPLAAAVIWHFLYQHRSRTSLRPHFRLMSR